MRKKRFTKYVGVMLSKETFQQLVEFTDAAEESLSRFIRNAVEEKLERERIVNKNV